MKKVLLVSDYVDSDGGISVQVSHLYKMFESDKNVEVTLFSTKSSYFLKIHIFFKLLQKAKKVNTIHSHGCSFWGFTTSILAFMVAKILNKKFILTYHGGDAKNYFDKFPIFKTVLKQSILTVPSGFLEKIFSEYGIKSNIIHNVLYSEKITFKKRTEFKPHLISTRFLKSVYDVKTILYAFKIIKDLKPTATLTVAGGGPELESLKLIVKNEKIKSVTFTGPVSNDKIIDLLNNNDIFVNASLKDNMPVSILEAFGSGLLVVSTNVGGIPYLIQDNKTGVLLEPNDSQELARRIISILKNQEHIKQIVQNARISSYNFSVEQVKEKWLEIYLK